MGGEKQDLAEVYRRELEELLDENDRTRKELARLLGWDEEIDAEWGWGKIYWAVSDTQKRATELVHTMEDLREDLWSKSQLANIKDRMGAAIGEFYK